MLDAELPRRRFRNILSPSLEYLREHQGLEFDGLRFVDIGAGRGPVSKALMELEGVAEVRALDVVARPHTYIPIEEFDGKRIPASDNHYDIALLLFVLHHTPDSMIRLLLEAKRVSKRYVIVTEDTCETDSDRDYRGRHDPGGVFLSSTGWKEIFKALDFDLLREGEVGYGKKGPGAVHRRFFVLKVPSPSTVRH